MQKLQRRQPASGGQRDKAAGLQTAVNGDDVQTVFTNRPSLKLDVTSKNHNSSPGPPTVSLGWILRFAFLVGACLVGWQYVVPIWQHHNELEYEKRLAEALDPMTREWEERVLALQEEKDRALKEVSVMSEKEERQMQEEHSLNENKQVIQLKEQVAEQRKLLTESQKQIETLKSYRKRMHEAIQAQSRQAVLEKFGPGPHRVEMLIEIDPADGGALVERIVLEMAPLDQMPHSIHRFLEQVDKKLWNDGCAFHRNAHHVVQSGTVSVKAEDAFRDARLESVFFQEYSSKFPHSKLTVGLAGRPGGPDFYINLKDNSAIHGPGGQTSYDEPGEADPCFAKVVVGEEVVWKIHALPNKENDAYEHFEHFVIIKEMKLL